MKKLLFLLVPALLFSDDLKSMLLFAEQNNNIIKSSKLSVDAKSKELTSAKSSYYPTLDTGAFYQREDKPSPFSPGTVYAAYAKVGVDIYDGGKKSYTKKQKQDEVDSASYSYKDTKKSILLDIVKDYYNLENAYAFLAAKEEALKAVKAQLTRMQEFYKAKLATSDDVDRLQSAYEKNIYDIESQKFQIVSLKKMLELKVGKNITSIEKSTFKKSLTQRALELDSTQSLRYSKKSLNNLAETIDSYYYPNIRLEDTYTYYGYQDKPSFGTTPISQLNNQNKIMATLNFRLVDFGVLGEQKEAFKLQAAALNEQIKYKTKEQSMQIELAKARIKTAQLNIQSSQSALKAATSALNTITQKYNAGIVDNVVYLDALSSKTEAKTLYKQSLNNLEIAYAIYYYYNSKNLLEYL